jgi:hypothetical protein
VVRHTPRCLRFSCPPISLAISTHRLGCSPLSRRQYTSFQAVPLSRSCMKSKQLGENRDVKQSSRRPPNRSCSASESFEDYQPAFAQGMSTGTWQHNSGGSMNFPVHSQTHGLNININLQINTVPIHADSSRLFSQPDSSRVGASRVTMDGASTQTLALGTSLDERERLRISVACLSWCAAAFFGIYILWRNLFFMPPRFQSMCLLLAPIRLRLALA